MSYKIAFTPQAMEDFNYWKSSNPKMTEKIKSSQSSDSGVPISTPRIAASIGFQNMPVLAMTLTVGARRFFKSFFLFIVQ